MPGVGAGLPTIAKRRVARIDPIGEYAPDAAALTPGTCASFSTTPSMKRTRVGRLHVSIHRQTDLERDHVLGSEARIDREQPGRALKKQSGREQEHDGGADLDAHEHLAEANGFARRTLRAQSRRERGLRGAARHDPAENQSRHHGQHDQEHDRRGAERWRARVARSGSGVRASAAGAVRSPRRCDRDRGDRRQHQVLDQQLSRQARLRWRRARCAPRIPIDARRCERRRGWRCWCRRAGRSRSRPGRGR